MLKRSRSNFLSLLLPLVIGATVGACAFVTKIVSDGAPMQWLGIPLLAITGAAFGFLPYIILAVPICLAMEHAGFHPTLKLLLLTLGGLGVGLLLGAPAIWSPLYAISVWTITTGGVTGLVLGLLRR